MKRLMFGLFAVLAMCLAMFSATASASPLHSAFTVPAQTAQHAPMACHSAVATHCTQTAHDASPVSLKTAASGQGAASALRAYESQRAAVALPKLAHGGGSGGMVAWLGDGHNPMAGKKGGGKKPPKRISA